jgi:hypothetical protein
MSFDEEIQKSADKQEQKKVKSWQMVSIDAMHIKFGMAGVLLKVIISTKFHIDLPKVKALVGTKVLAFPQIIIVVALTTMAYYFEKHVHDF